MSHGANSTKSIYLALSANALIAVAKALAAVFTHSGAMLAEAIHSAADTANQLLLLLGLKQAKRPPSTDYPLGYGKAVYFWSFVVALLLFSVGGVFSVYEGLHKLQHPEPLNAPWIAVSVLIFAMCAEGFALRGCIQEINKIRGDQSYWTWFRETRHSELMVIFGEDLAALLGLSLALLALFAAIITGNPLYDAFGSIAIGVLLIIVAVLLSIEVKALLVGQGVEKQVRKAMLDFLGQQPKVDQVLNMVTLQMGQDVMVAVKAKMCPAESGRVLVDYINETERAFREAFPQVMWLFFEPDTED